MKLHLPSNQAPAPTPADTGDDNPQDSLGELIQSAVAEGFAELRKELAPARRFANPIASEEFKVPATVKRYSSLRHFAGKDADERAYRFGMFCLAVYGKKQGEWVPALGGIALITISYFISSALYMSLPRLPAEPGSRERPSGIFLPPESW